MREEVLFHQSLNASVGVASSVSKSVTVPEDSGVVVTYLYRITEDNNRRITEDDNYRVTE